MLLAFLRYFSQSGKYAGKKMNDREKAIRDAVKACDLPLAKMFGPFPEREYIPEKLCGKLVLVGWERDLVKFCEAFRESHRSSEFRDVIVPFPICELDDDMRRELKKRLAFLGYTRTFIHCKDGKHFW